jgi:hypothetical protein
VTNWRRLAVQPDPGFADRLEARLEASLRRSGASLDDNVNDDEGDLMTIDLDTAERLPTSSRPTSRWVWLAVAAALLLVVGVVALTQANSNDPADTPGTAGFEVAFETTWPWLGDVGKQECFSGLSTDSELADAGNCLRVFNVITDFVGDISGQAATNIIAGVGSSRDGDATVVLTTPHNITYLFRGSISGCGTGEFMIAEVLEFVGWESGMYVGTWQIVPGSGRGELQGVSGSGIVEPQDATGAEMVRPHVGTVSC